MKSKTNRILKIISLIIVFSLMFAVFAACDKDEDPAETVPQANDQTDAGETEASETVKESSDGKKIGMVIKHTNTEYTQAFIIAAQKECDALGIELLVTDGEADSLKIIAAIENFIVQDIDGFILAGAEDLKTLVPGILDLNEEGIPVMALDTCPEGGRVEMFITFSIVDSSERAALQMIEGIKEANDGEVPEGVLIEITGSLVDMFTVDCREGVQRVWDQYPQLTIVQGEGKWNNDDSYDRTSDLLTRYGDEVVGVYVHTPDIMGSGAVSAVENAGYDPADFFISGICLGMEGLDLMRENKLYAVVEQPAYDSAVLAVQYLDDLFNGRELPKVGDTVTDEGALWSPAEIIENVHADEGATMVLKAAMVPVDVDVDDARLWENQIGK